MKKKNLSAETLIDLHKKISLLPPRSEQRRVLMQETAQLYGISEQTLYRLLQERVLPKAVKRSDYGDSRVLPKQEMSFYCELIAAIKLRTTNKKGRHLSTSQAIRLLEESGVTTPRGFVKVEKSLLKISTVNRHLKNMGYDQRTLRKSSPAVRFQAQHSNECWHFDLSPSDLKKVEKPLWYKEGEGHPLLMLYSIVDDRSGVAYQEYHCVFGEDVEAALRFLFNAMSKKEGDKFPIQGIPDLLYMDNGPIAKSHVFQRVMKYLGVEVKTHLPPGKVSHKTAARAKGKVERPFRSVKEMHETLYHFHKPETEVEANQWLNNFLIRYNTMQHRQESHSRFDDWVKNLPTKGITQMCHWDRFATFAREPQERRAGIDARVCVDNICYEIDPELSGEMVVLWWGLFDNELYIEWGEKRYGPYFPVGDPIPLHKYRAFKKTNFEKNADKIEALAKQIDIPRSALEGDVSQYDDPTQGATITIKPFIDPDPFMEFTFPNAVEAKLAIAAYLQVPLARLEKEQLDKINEILSQTLKKSSVMEKIAHYFKPLNRDKQV